MTFHDRIVVGAGPSGLRSGHLFDVAGRDPQTRHVIITAGDGARFRRRTLGGRKVCPSTLLLI